MSEEKIIIAENGEGDRIYIPESKLQETMEKYAQLREKIRLRVEQGHPKSMLDAAEKCFNFRIVKDEKSGNNNPSD